MLLRITALLLLAFILDVGQINCVYRSSSKPSRTSGFGSRPSYGSSRPSNVISRPSPSYGWRVTSRTTSRPRTTRRHYPVTTMPTHRTTRRHYPVTTMPTHRTTKRHYPVTTMPTHKTTRRQFITTTPHPKQPPFNPFYPNPRPNNQGRHNITNPHRNPIVTATSKPVNHVSTTSHTKQPPFNPFFSTPRPSNQGRHNMTNPHHQNPFVTSTSRPLNQVSTTSHTRQPPFNPFFLTPRPGNQGKPNMTNPHRNPLVNSTTSHTKQPPFNPFFSTPRPGNQGKPNMTHPHQNPLVTSTYRPVNQLPSRSNYTDGRHPNSGRNISQTLTSRQPPFNPYLTSTSRPGNQYPNRNNSSIGHQSTNNHTNFTPKPSYPDFQGNQGKMNFSRPGNKPSDNWHPTSTWHQQSTPPKFTQPTWNRTTGHGINHNQPIYNPPGHIAANPHQSYVTGSHPTVHHPTTTIINNNNHHYYPGGGYYHPTSGSTPHVTIINNNNYYNPNHRVIIPSSHYYGYGPPAVGITVLNTDYYSHPISPHYVTTYHYSSVDYGSTSLGFFLGYQLGKISRPSYYYHSTTYVNNEYVPRYDHYTVHHYYHNRESVPKEAPIQPNAIVVCPGDTGNMCPNGNIPLCTNNGAVMCVVNAQSTAPCSDNAQTNCAKTTISCEGNNAPECRQQKETTLSVPCISTAKIDAGLGVVNNSLIVTDANDSGTKSLCVTILAVPSQSKNATKAGLTPPPAPEDINQPFQYTTNDTGVSLLGYYLGSKLQNLSEPTFSFLNYDEHYNYIEKYNHFDIYHYDHGANILPNVTDIKPEQIMSCAGDSGTFCPSNTTSLCLNDGAVICVTELNSTLTYNSTQSKYIYSNISCANLKSPACNHNSSLSILVEIPCISTARLFGKASYVIKSYATNSIYYKTLEPVLNGTVAETLTTPRELCVTVLVIPGVKDSKETLKPRKISGIKESLNAYKLPYYSYSTKDTGNNTFGLLLLNKVDKLKYPSYYWINAYLYQTFGEVQKYDHYSLHYYNYSDEIIPKDLVLDSSQLTPCDGDAGLLCPFSFNTLCLTDGSVWCAKDLLLTETCDTNTSCVKSEVSCTKVNSKHCKGAKKTTLSVNCIATLTVYGEVMSVSNSVYKVNKKAAKNYTDVWSMPGAANNTNKAQHFCVGVVAIPEERKTTVGENVFVQSDSLFGKIASQIFGL